MKKSEWGPCIWKTLHVLTIKIKDEAFNEQRKKLIDMLIQMCSNLPCPICSSHAMIMIRKYNLKNMKTKEGLIKTLFLMHNEVNGRLKKPLFVYDTLIPTYKAYNTREIMSDYYNKNIRMKFGEKMMLHSFHRKTFLMSFIRYIRQNIDKFDV
tara:strand:- start:210 stop:668 length:459 start_codon:yes stop_codon:yes gene_type:complete